MKELICKNCGGRIHPTKMRCEYCGTQYSMDGPTSIVIERGHAIPLQAELAVSNDFIHCLEGKEIEKIIHSEMTRKIAEALEPYVEYMVSESPTNPFDGQQIVRGRVRVLPPGYRF